MPLVSKKSRKRLFTDLFFCDKNGLEVKKKGSLINKGYFGSVCTMKSELDDNMYAVKILNIKALISKNDTDVTNLKFKDAKKNLLNEAKILSNIDNINIIKYYQTRTTNRSIYIFMEYINNGTLENYIKTTILTKETINTIIKQVLSALKYIHSIKIIHRDIKPDNIFVKKLITNELIIKLGDFGLSKILPNSVYTQPINNMGKGHICYRSPESIYSKEYDFKDDIWSAGCVLLEMMCGMLLPTAITSNCFAVSNTKNEYIDQITEDYDDYDDNLLGIVAQKLLDINPSSRASADDALKYLNNPILIKFPSLKRQKSTNILPSINKSDPIPRPNTR